MNLVIHQKHLLGRSHNIFTFSISSWMCWKSSNLTLAVSPLRRDTAHSRPLLEKSEAQHSEGPQRPASNYLLTTNGSWFQCPWNCSTAQCEGFPTFHATHLYSNNPLLHNGVPVVKRNRKDKVQTQLTEQKEKGQNALHPQPRVFEEWAAPC